MANGYYQGPWGVNVGGNYVMRQGYTEMFFSNDVGTNDPVYQQKDIVVIPGRIGEFRLPNVHSLDVRIEKAFRFDRTQVTLDFDVFNLPNNGTVLGRIYDVSSSKFNDVAEIMATSRTRRSSWRGSSRFPARRPGRSSRSRRSIASTAAAPRRS